MLRILSSKKIVTLLGRNAVGSQYQQQLITTRFNSISAAAIPAAASLAGHQHQQEQVPTLDKALLNSGYSWRTRPAMTKIVATIGPASENHPMLQNVVTAGMRIMRVNFSHATYEEADLRMVNLRAAHGIGSKAFGETAYPFNLRAVMLDTQGPEIRTGSFSGGVKEVELCSDDEVVLTTAPEARNAQSRRCVWISYQDLGSTVGEGSVILLDDGAIELRVLGVVATTAHGGVAEVRCRVVNSGMLGNKKGVNIPGHKLTLPAMSDKDKQDLRWGVANDVDYIAASFTRRASDVHEIRDYLASLHQEMGLPATHPLPLIIAKIESTEALENFDEILFAADGIMVARGDLGVEIPMETLTNWQKELVLRCNQAGKPVVVATQMLESMQKSPRPTRAECTDVANAVFDGADCVMLSGESAKGRYPVQSVAMMKRIIDQSEAWLAAHPAHLVSKSTCESLNEGVARAVVATCGALDVKCVLVHGSSGASARQIAMFRPMVPVVAFAASQKIARQLQLYRGVHPVVLAQHAGGSGLDDSSAAVSSTSRPIHAIEIETAVSMGFCRPGDTVIVVASEEGSADSVLGPATAIRVVQVQHPHGDHKQHHHNKKLADLQQTRSTKNST